MPKKIIDTKRGLISGQMLVMPIVAIIVIGISVFNFFYFRSSNKQLAERLSRVEQATFINAENLKKLVDYINAANQKAQEIQAQQSAGQEQDQNTADNDETPALDEADVENTSAIDETDSETITE